MAHRPRGANLPETRLQPYFEGSMLRRGDRRIPRGFSRFECSPELTGMNWGAGASEHQQGESE